MADHTEDRDALAAVLSEVTIAQGNIAAYGRQHAAADAILASGWLAARVAAERERIAQAIEATADGDLPHLSDDNPVKQQVQHTLRRAARIAREGGDRG